MFPMSHSFQRATDPKAAMCSWDEERLHLAKLIRYLAPRHSTPDGKWILSRPALWKDAKANLPSSYEISGRTLRTLETIFYKWREQNGKVWRKMVEEEAVAPEEFVVRVNVCTSPVRPFILSMTDRLTLIQIQVPARPVPAMDGESSCAQQNSLSTLVPTLEGEMDRKEKEGWDVKTLMRTYLYVKRTQNQRIGRGMETRFAAVKRLLNSRHSEEYLHDLLYNWKRLRPTKWQREMAAMEKDSDGYFREIVSVSAVSKGCSLISCHAILLISARS